MHRGQSRGCLQGRRRLKTARERLSRGCAGGGDRRRRQAEGTGVQGEGASAPRRARELGQWRAEDAGSACAARERKPGCQKARRATAPLRRGAAAERRSASTRGKQRGSSFANSLKFTAPWLAAWRGACRATAAGFSTVLPNDQPTQFAQTRGHPLLPES